MSHHSRRGGLLMRRLLGVTAALLLLAGCSGSDDALTTNELDGNSYTSTDVTGRDLVEGTTVELTFEDGHLAVAAGCNTQTAAYDVEDDAIAWTGEPAATLKACSDELTAQDNWLNALFLDGVPATLDGETLTLKNGDVEIVLEAT